MTIGSISVSEVYAAHQLGKIALIDVREIDEFEAISCTLAQNFPLSSLDIAAIESRYKKNEPLYVMCRSGKRSLTAAAILQEAGFKHLYNVEGGILAWSAAGLPIASVQV